MFPDIQPKDGLAASREQIGGVLIGVESIASFPISDDQPRPAGTEAAQPAAPNFS